MSSFGFLKKLTPRQALEGKLFIQEVVEMQERWEVEESGEVRQGRKGRQWKMCSEAGYPSG